MTAPFLNIDPHIRPASPEAPGNPSPRTLHVRLGCEFHYANAAETAFVALVEPPALAERATLVRADRLVTPGGPPHLFGDPFGNRCWRFNASTPTLTFRYDAVFAVPEAPDAIAPNEPELPVTALPDDVLQFTLPSRFCQSDLLLEEGWRLFGDVQPGWSRVQAICDWVHEHVRYGYGNSSPTTSAVDTFQSLAGVCRDFAHLPIAFCRALNIPARYCFGYLPDYGVVPPDVPMDFHAWFEAYLGGRWYAFDARHNVPRVGRVKVGHGRDAVDVAMVTTYGNAQLVSMTVWADAAPVEE